MTSPAQNFTEAVTVDTDGVVNPCFVEIQEDCAPRIQTRNLQPGIVTTTSQGFSHSPGIVTTSQAFSHSQSSLPDILNSHLPPPYEDVVVTERRRQRRRRHHSEKSCCWRFLTSVTRFRWLLLTMSLLGISCLVAGATLGVLHMAGSSFITLSLMFIGLGVIMIVVVVIGWRCTPRGHEPCHLLLNLGEFSRSRRRRHSSSTSTGSRGGRRGREYGRRTYWSGGVIYSDHQYRQPPPSYAAAMQDFERQLLARMNNIEPLPNSPPPTYKSQATMPRPGMRSIFPDEPPTYRSRPGTLRSTLQRNDAQCQENVTSVTVHHDTLTQDDVLSTGSAEDSTIDQSTMDYSTMDQSSANEEDPELEYSTDYGTAERSAVLCLENSINTEGCVNASMVLDDDSGATNSDAANMTKTTKEQNVELNTASLLRAADQNLQRQWAREPGSARFIPRGSPRYGSARMTSQSARPVIGQLSHVRSSSASGVDFHYQEHRATLV